MINLDVHLSRYDLVPPVSTFAMAVAGTNNETLGVRTGDGRYVLKRYPASHGPYRLRYEHDLLMWLAGRGLSFAVPAPVATPTGATWLHDGGGFCVLLPLLAGRRPDYRSPAHVEAVGAALGELHGTLRRNPRGGSPHMPSFADLSGIHRRIPHPESLTPSDLGWAPTSRAAELCSWWRAECRHTLRFAAEAYPVLPRQVIHGDFVPSNTLHDGARASAVLDFEFAAPDARVMDVASGLKYSMRVWENEDPWTSGAHFCRGYARFATLMDREIAALVEATILRDAVSVLWHFGRAIDEGRRPQQQRLHDAREAASWLKTHRSEVEALLIEAFAR